MEKHFHSFDFIVKHLLTSDVKSLREIGSQQ